MSVLRTTMFLTSILLVSGCLDSTGDRRRPRMLCLGDSYTIGESVKLEDRWPVQLVTLLRNTGINVRDPQIIATTGWTTNQLMAGIDKASPQGPFELVTLLIGVNDQYAGSTAEQFRGRFAILLERSIALADGQPARVIVLSIPDWGVMPFAEEKDRAKIAGEIDAFNTVCRDESRRAGVRFVDITPISRRAGDDESLVADDGLHPSGKMYFEWVQLILPEAARALDPKAGR